MIEPTNANQINNIQKLDSTSDVAGAAGVTPSYIPSDTADAIQPDKSVNMDQVQISNKYLRSTDASLLHDSGGKRGNVQLHHF